MNAVFWLDERMKMQLVIMRRKLYNYLYITLEKEDVLNKRF